MAQQASDDWLTTTTDQPGFDFHPFGMGCRHVIRESADLPLCGVLQPADTILWCMAVNKWAVLAWHDATLAKWEPFWGTEALNNWSIWGMCNPLINLKLNPCNVFPPSLPPFSLLALQQLQRKLHLQRIQWLHLLLLTRRRNH
jgi:hypothetical protein